MDYVNSKKRLIHLRNIIKNDQNHAQSFNESIFYKNLRHEVTNRITCVNDIIKNTKGLSEIADEISRKVN